MPGILFHAPDNVIREFPQFPAVHTFEDLKQEFIKASNRVAEPVKRIVTSGLAPE